MNSFVIKYFLLFVIIFQFEVDGNSQTGSIILKWDKDNSINYRIHYWELVKNDSLILSSGSKHNNQEYEHIYNIPIGTYSLIMYKKEELLSCNYGLVVSEDSTSEYNIYFEAPKLKPIEIDDVRPDNLFSIKLDLLTSIDRPSYNSLINQEFYCGMLEEKSVLLSNYLEIGASAGTSLSYVDFDNDTSYYPVKTIKNERYFSWNFDLAASLIVASKKKGRFNAQAAFLELGAIYHFPLIFKHVYIENTRKVSTSQLHQFKNVALQARIGYENIALMASYRLFDYVNGSYPELPKVKVGLSFNISE